MREAKRAHVADRAATQDEATAAEESREKFADKTQDVAEHEESMAKRGAEIKARARSDSRGPRRDDARESHLIGASSTMRPIAPWTDSLLVADRPTVRP